VLGLNPTWTPAILTEVSHTELCYVGVKPGLSGGTSLGMSEEQSSNELFGCKTDVMTGENLIMRRSVSCNHYLILLGQLDEI
jgi:hypothetical protein